MAKRKKNKEEVSLYFCIDHADVEKEPFYPGYKFSYYPSYNPQKCMIDGCQNPGYYKFLGIYIPDSIGELINTNSKAAITETFNEALEVLQSGNSGEGAIIRLTKYLYFKLRTYHYSTGDFIAYNMCRKFAELILTGFNINFDASLNANEIHAIVNWLELYPSEDLAH